MWEYEAKFIEFKTYQNLINELNLMGADGWEVFSFENEGSQFKGYKATLLFKRFKKL